MLTLCIGPGTCHELDILTELLQTVEVGHPDTLAQRDHQERDVGRVVVENCEDVAARSIGEH